MFLNKKRFCLLLSIVLLIAFAIYTLTTFVLSQIKFWTHAQNLVDLSSNPFVSATISGIISTVIGGVILYVLLGRQKKIDLDKLFTPEVINAVAFKVSNACAQMLSKGLIPTERQQEFHNDIQNSWASFLERNGTSRLAPEFKALFSAKETDAIAYVWPGHADFGNQLPYGTLLTGLTGDLILAIKIPVPSFTTDFGFSASHKARETWDTVAIYIPPDFKVPGAHAISTISGAIVRTQVLKASPYDPYGPRWTVIYVSADTTNSDGTRLGLISSSPFVNFRIKDVTAPSMAGKYFFKIALFNSKSPHMVRGEDVSDLAGLDERALQFISVENWPVMLVKGEIQTGSIDGNIRVGDYNRALYNKPIQEAGRIWAQMKDRIGPYTGEARPDLPKVDAVTYFNATAQGHYELEGLAPGVYSLYASAAGYPQQVVASKVTVLKGQSLHIDGHLQPGPMIHGNVLSKRGMLDYPWIETTPIKIELYDDYTKAHVTNPRARMVSWSPSTRVARGQGLVHISGVGSDGKLQSNGTDKSLQRGPQAVGPTEDWCVQGGTTNPFQFEFGVKGEYGAPRDLDGMVPQLYATWVNGLTPGRYYARAWVFHYVQSDADGSTFLEYWFDVVPNDWAGDKTLSIELRTN